MVYIFLGPTVPVEEASIHLDAVFLPPAGEGDVYRASQTRPQAIGIVDGYFERIPSVRHKEILWALSQGIHVYGSASMGALRAVELAPFGMEGIGTIFEAYRDGVLEDDDEVAVIHAPAEYGFFPMSEPMINIRYTLAAAEATKVLTASSRSMIETIAKNLFYAHRRYPLIFELAANQGVPVAEIEALRAWLPRVRVDKKREDALMMLETMRELMATNAPPKRVTFSFEYTEWWHKARQEAERGAPDWWSGDEKAVIDGALDELRLEGESYIRARRGALLRHLALREARLRGITVDNNLLPKIAGSFRVARGLVASGDAEQWLTDNGLNEHGIDRLMHEEAMLTLLDASFGDNATLDLPNYLRVTGEMSRLVLRAREKHQTLISCGFDGPELRDTGLSETELLRWCFEEHLGLEVVRDPETGAHRLGFADANAFMTAVIREFCYLHLCNGQKSSERTFNVH